MPFQKLSDYSTFAHEVMNEYRFIRTPFVTEFLKSVSETAASRTHIIKEGTWLFRAQMGCVEDFVYNDQDELIDLRYLPLSVERMKPTRQSASEGRVNPKGITYLYAAITPQTALAELRPWKGAHVTIATLEMTRDFRFVDFSADAQTIVISDLTPELTEKAVWGDINAAFSKPIQPSDAKADYVPTQVLAEQFKLIGYDGVAFRSSVGEKENLVLFDLDGARVCRRWLHRVDSVQYESSRLM